VESGQEIAFWLQCDIREHIVREYIVEFYSVTKVVLENLLVAVRHVAHQISEIERGVIIHVRLHVGNPWPGASHPSVYDVDACSIGPPAVPQPLEHLIKWISVDMNTRQACGSVARADLQRASKESTMSMLTIVGSAFLFNKIG
jgi:hypothetical protein